MPINVEELSELRLPLQEDAQLLDQDIGKMKHIIIQVDILIKI